ncbi:unnamed protein product, partial [Chrysoparadoxa australica]
MEQQVWSGRQGAGENEVSERERLLNLLCRWKTAEAWREVVVISGVANGHSCDGEGFSCEVLMKKKEEEEGQEQLDRAFIRQLIVGPITAKPSMPGAPMSQLLALERSSQGYEYQLVTGASSCMAGSPMPGERSYLEAYLDVGSTPAGIMHSDGMEAVLLHPRGIQASLSGQIHGQYYANVTMLLGPVIGRVTQATAV